MKLKMHKSKNLNNDDGENSKKYIHIGIMLINNLLLGLGIILNKYFIFKNMSCLQNNVCS